MSLGLPGTEPGLGPGPTAMAGKKDKTMHDPMAKLAPGMAGAVPVLTDARHCAPCSQRFNRFLLPVGSGGSQGSSPPGHLLRAACIPPGPGSAFSTCSTRLPSVLVSTSDSPGGFAGRLLPCFPLSCLLSPDPTQLSPAQEDFPPPRHNLRAVLPPPTPCMDAAPALTCWTTVSVSLFPPLG